MLQTFEPTREAATSRLSSFLPRAGRAYADDRNHDHGPARRSNVSVLSPYIRHRLITEREVVEAVLAQHSLQAAEKYVQEVLWRTYWKGWLELRPQVWQRYLMALEEKRAQVEGNGGLRKDHRAAIEGRTGIEGFDDWVHELRETGYLHNHARMWFASIWIFTLRLPWELGADFFMQHLVDGDPASNTLSWRWVAGLQTRGKNYVATRDNIAKYTAGRFAPTGLVASPAALEEDDVGGARALEPWPDQIRDDAALLLTDDDYGFETLGLDTSRIKAVAVADLAADRSAQPVSAVVAEFTDGAARDTLSRAAALLPQAAVTTEPMRRLTANDILPWLEKSGVKALVVPSATVGPSASALAALAPALNKAGVSLIRLRRGWDARAWPHANKGFFPFKEKIPSLLRSEGLPA